jgi:predicted HTH transcriptional regulator
MPIQSIAYLHSLVRELAKLPNETEWVEFKTNYHEPQMIGEYISALSNSAALCGKPKGYLIWGTNNMPAPRVESQNNQFTKVVLMVKTPFDMMSKKDKIRTCYMQACLAYVSYSAISNADIRALFGLSDVEMSKASRIIKETIEEGLIKPLDSNTAPRYMKYIPFWA